LQVFGTVLCKKGVGFCLEVVPGGTCSILAFFDSSSDAAGDIYNLARNICKLVGAAFGKAKVRFTDSTSVARLTYDSPKLLDSVAVINFIHKLGDKNKMKLLRDYRVSVPSALNCKPNVDLGVPSSTNYVDFRNMLIYLENVATIQLAIDLGIR